MGLISRVSSRTYRKKSQKNTKKMQLFVQGTQNLSNITVENESEFFNQLNEGSTVQVNVRVLGGKVHGSLARAGKVKGQTPKVEPAEKKKHKTGRAKRRMQYNRRFVTESNTFG